MPAKLAKVVEAYTEMKDKMNQEEQEDANLELDSYEEKYFNASVNPLFEVVYEDFDSMQESQQAMSREGLEKNLGKQAGYALIIERNVRTADTQIKGLTKAIETGNQKAIGAAFASMQTTFSMVCSTIFSALGLAVAYDSWDTAARHLNAFQAALKTTTEELKSVVEYAEAKARRGWVASVVYFIRKVVAFSVAIAGLITGPGAAVFAGIGALIDGSIALLSGLFTAVRGFIKWLLGTKGKNRHDNALKLIQLVKNEDHEAAKLLLDIEVSVFNDKIMDTLVKRNIGLACQKVDLVAQLTTKTELVGVLGDDLSQSKGVVALKEYWNLTTETGIIHVVQTMDQIVSSGSFTYKGKNIVVSSAARAIIAGQHAGLVANVMYAMSSTQR